MIALKVHKIGNSLGIMLPRKVISRLGVREGEEVFLLEEPNNTYRLTPLDPTCEKKIKEAGEVARFRSTLHVLTK